MNYESKRQPFQHRSRGGQRGPLDRSLRGPEQKQKQKPMPFLRRVRRAWLRHPVGAFLNHKPKVVFFHELYRLVKSGRPISLSLTEMAAHRFGRFRRELMQASKEIDRGKDLSGALGGVSVLWDDVSVELIAAGEKSGTLEAVLKDWTEQLEEIQKLRWRVVGLSLYPMYLVGAILFGSALVDLVSYISAVSGASFITGALGGSAFVEVIKLIVLFVGLFFLPLVLSVVGLERGWDAIWLKVPVVGYLKRRFYGSRFLMALGCAQGAGLEVGGSIHLAARATGSALLASRGEKMLSRVRSGGTLVEGIKALELFDQTTLGTLFVGEKAGELESTFKLLAVDQWDSAHRGLRFAIIGGFVLVVVALGLFAVTGILPKLLSPVQDYYRLLNSIVDSI